MTGTRLSDESVRERLRTELDATFFVEAGAGTGKTAALVTRIVELVARDELRMECLAAITFTEAAAAELRDRLRQALEQAAIHRGSLEERSRCEIASREVDLASVQTIHAFAGSLLRTYPLEAGLPPNFLMLDELEQERSFDDRFRAWLYDEVPADELPERRAAVRRALTLGITAEQLRELAARLQEYRDLLNSTTLWPSPPVQDPGALAREWGGVIRRLAFEAAAEALDPEDNLAIELRRLRNIADAMSAVNDSEEALRLLVQCSPRWNAGSQRNWPPGRCKAIKDVLHECLDVVTAALNDHRSAAFADLLHHMRDFTLSFADDRKQAGTATFHDLLTWARNLLRDDAHVRRRAQDQYDRLFVDEFQDTDPLQVEIAWFLTSDPTECHERDWKKLRLVPGKLFIVGDPKQSIYRFRRADIGIYDEVYARLAKPSDRAVLSQSFRSPAGLVEWFNHHFERDMQRVEHVQPRYEPLDPRLDGTDASIGSCFHVTHFGYRIDGAAERWQAEADATARVAAQIVLGDTPWQVFDKAENRVRGARFDDICVLIPTRTNLRGLERTFQRQNVPFRMESGWLVLQTQEVRDLLSCLRAIDDSSDQVALVAALRSPAYACSDVDLLRWVNASGRFDYERPGQGCEGPVLNALVSLRAFHDARMRHTPSELTELFIRDRMLAVQAFGGSKPREALRRLRYVVAQARRLASNGPSSLRSLCDWLESRQREQYYDAESPVPDADENAVRFMTVHGSKGLEFPIVILTGLGTATSRVGPQSVDLVPDYHADILNIRCGDFLTAGYDRATEKAMYEAEQIRLLYVATTRARDHLVLSLFHGRDACHATRILERLHAQPELSRELTMAGGNVPTVLASVTPPTTNGTSTLTPEAHRANEEAFVADRESLIARVAKQTIVAPSRLAHAEVEPEISQEQPEPPPEPDPQIYVHRLPKGRGGSALGRAVHAVLQVIDLATLSDIELLAAAAAHDEGVSDLVDTLVDYVRNAASSEPVQRAVSSGRYWREVPIGVRWNDDALLEGTIDLLFEQPAQALHLVDYKTDRITEAQLLRRASAYRTQVHAYATSLERVAGRRVAEASLVFCSLNRVVMLTPGADGAWTSINDRSMQPGSKRWHVVTESEHAHEREGLAYVRQVLPDRAPFQAWSNFEFVDANGTWSEVDLLVLGEESLHLVELKHYQGDIRGNAYSWQLAHRSEESPLEKAGKKARRLAGVLRSAARRLGLSDADVPFVKQSVFLHADNTRCLLPESDRAGLYGLDEAERQSNLPGISRLLLEPSRRGAVNESRVLAIIDAAGFALRREREVGSWRLIGPPLDESDEWQDWPAEHRVTRRQARIRFFTTPRGASLEQLANTRKLVEREYGLTSRLRHPGILAPQDIVEDELGSGLVFPSEDRDQRLDLWLADHGSNLNLRAQVDLIRQLAEALQYAHSNGVVHRALNPTAILIRPEPDGSPRSLVGGWQVAGVLQSAGSGAPTTQGMATRIFGQLDEQRQGTRAQANDAYVAPEGQWRPDVNRSRLDLFALGALAYLLVTGRDPATSGVELKQRLERERGLDLAADLPQTSDALRELVLAATNPVVGERLRDVSAFLERLSRVERELGSLGTDTDIDPLEAPPGTLIGNRFELVRRLGSGSTAVGLLVKDRQAGSELRVLKVALDDNAARRLDAEAEVLIALASRKANRVVRILQTTPLEVGDRRALLLESAGEDTLADVLRERRRLSLDLLERWGSDLLEALVSLDAAGVDHRDIKPANLGVREQRSDRAKHLVLFDFSLARASAATISAGTPPYLDPFLGTGTRQHWDSAAERYAAAVTLFEMATGHAPVWGDGETDPQFVERATIEPGDFDPVAADALVPFFEKALARDARARHGTAADMLANWRSALATSTSTTPEDANELAESVTLETPLPLSGLTPRALSALEPFRLQTVADLATLDTGRLSRFAGIVDVTKREIRSRAKQWRERFAAELQATASNPEPNESTDPFTAPDRAVRMLIQTVEQTAKAPAVRKAAAILLGLEGDVDPFAARGELTTALALGTQAQALGALAGIRDAWAQSADAARMLDDVFARAVNVIEGLDGAAWADSIVAALCPPGAVPRDRRLVGGIVRAAMDRAEDKARGADEESPIARRRRKDDRRLLVTRSAEVADIAGKLGKRAQRLVDEAAAASEFVVPRGRSVPALREIWTAQHPPLDDIRLIRLAARLSDAAGASASGELYSMAMPVVDAVRLALGSTMPAQRFSVQAIQQLVQVRFPGIAAVPGRPGLDSTLAQAGTGLVWSEDAYAIPSAHSDTTFGTPTALPAIPITLAERRGHLATSELHKSVVSRSFLALGVPAKHAERVAAGLVSAFGAAEVNVSNVLLDALNTMAAKAGVPWETVLAADAAAPDSVDERGLKALVGQSIPEVQTAIDTALQDGADRPVLLTEAAPLARYKQMPLLSQLADIATARPQAVWLIVPEEGDGGPMLDHVPVPLTYASQYLRLDSAFMSGEGDA